MGTTMKIMTLMKSLAWPTPHVLNDGESDEVEDNIRRNDEAVSKDDAAEIAVNVIKTVLESAPLIENENENKNVEISFRPKNAAAVHYADESEELEDYIKRNDEEYAVNKELV